MVLAYSNRRVNGYLIPSKNTATLLRDWSKVLAKAKLYKEVEIKVLCVQVMGY